MFVIKIVLKKVVVVHHLTSSQLIEIYKHKILLVAEMTADNKLSAHAHYHRVSVPPMQNITRTNRVLFVLHVIISGLDMFGRGYYERSGKSRPSLLMFFIVDSRN